MRHQSSFPSLTRQAASSSSQSQFLGYLQEKDESGKVVNSKRLFADQELIIGRDGNRCQYVLDDPAISNKHLRIYAVVYDDDNPNNLAPLVYAEDLSRNGTFWNGSLIGKGNGGFLLSDGDTLRVSARKLFVYRMTLPREGSHLFDSVQEHEMNHFRRDYIITDRLLGAGAYGRVHMAIEQNQRTQLACKIIDLRKLQPPSRMSHGFREQPALAGDVDSRIQLAKVKSWGQKQKRENRPEERLKTCYREAEILASLIHPNIIGLEKVYLTDNSIYIFQDLVTAGDLFSYIELKNGKLLDIEAAVVVRQILVALEFLHDKDIVHRDLKPENILMTTLASGCRVVLTDFGCARRLDRQQRRMRTSIGTYGYIAPEMPHEQNSNAPTGGYTKAVDLWSLGCVAVVLLTGGYPFFEPGSTDYSMEQAIKGNLDPLEKSETWKDVGARPKDFVRRLLVLDEQQRMSAKDSLAHEWFMNDIHRIDFEELYRRATRHWRPRIPKEPVVELIEAENLETHSFLQGIGPRNKEGGKRGPQPVDPPYKPFPHRLHNHALFPKRRTSPFQNSMSNKVKSAIRSHWNFEKSHSSGSSVEQGRLRKPRTLGTGEENENSLTDEPQKDYPLASAQSPPFLSKIQRSKSLRPEFALGSTDPIKHAEKSASEAKSGKAESYYAEPEERDVALVRKAYSPTAWRKGAEPLSSTKNKKAKLTFPNRRMAARPLRGLVDINNGTNLLQPLGTDARMLHISQHFTSRSPLETIKQQYQQAKCLDEGACFSDKHSLRETTVSSKSDRQKCSSHLAHNLLKLTQNIIALDSESAEGAGGSPSTPGSVGAFCDNEDVPTDSIGPKRASAGPRVRSPACTVGHILEVRSCNMKKRQSQFNFNFEEDTISNLRGQSKRAKVEIENIKRQGKATSVSTSFPETKVRV